MVHFRQGLIPSDIERRTYKIGRTILHRVDCSAYESIKKIYKIILMAKK